ncbi:MAG: M1 family aminopeptidase, partial [Polyangiaceae bacterium]
MLATLVAAAACTPNTDLTVAPPRVDPSFEVDIPEPRADGRLPAWARPLHYRLLLDIDPTATRFAGEALIDVELDEPTGALVMHAADMTFGRVEVTTAGGQVIPAEVSYRAAAGAADEREELVVVTTSQLPAEEVRVRLEYTAPLEETLAGIYRTQEAGKSYAFTQLEPSDARRLFPGFDDPVYKVPFDVEVTTPAGNVVLANSPELSRRPEGDRTRFIFTTTEKLPTYLVALAVGPLDVIDGPSQPTALRLAAAEGKAGAGAYALETAARQLEHLEQWFKRPYPYAKLDLVAVPNFGPGAMENAGLVTFREELLLVDRDQSSAKARRDMAMTMAHELAHQWFGNLVTMRWWDDLWLNEGFATYMESLIVDELDPGTGGELELLGLIGWVMDFDALESARRVRQPVAHTYEAEEAFDGITYIKGAAVLRMIHRWLGDAAFRDGVQRYLTRHAWSNATASDLFMALSTSSKRDVAPVAASFLDQPGLPLVRAELRCEGNARKVVLSQTRYRARPSTTATAELWQIPVCLSYPTGTRRAARIARACDVLRDETMELELSEASSCPSWVLPNEDHAGYYRYALPPKQLEALGATVGKLDTATKVGFLTNLWALVQAGEVEGVQLIDTLVAFKGAPEREVVEQLIALLGRVSDALVEPAARPAFERLASAILLPQAKKLGWDNAAADDEDRRLVRRSLLTALAVHTSEPWLVREGTVRANRWLADPSSVDADTAVIALRVAARHGAVGREQLMRVHDALKNDTAKRVVVVQALASLPKKDDLVAVLDALKSGKLKSQDAVYVARTAADWADSRAVLVRWLSDNLGAIADKMPSFGVARMVAPVRRVCSKPQRDEAERALTPVVAQIGGSDRRLREALEGSAVCIDLRERQAA